MRLDALEERQRCLRQEVAGPDFEAMVSERVWQAAKEIASRSAEGERSLLDRLARRVDVLEHTFVADGRHNAAGGGDRAAGRPEAFAEAALMAEGIASKLHTARLLSGLQPPHTVAAPALQALPTSSATLASCEGGSLEGEAIRQEVAAIWHTLADLAELAGVSHNAASKEAQVRDGDGRDSKLQAAAAAATAATSAVRNATTVVGECQQRVTRLAEDFATLRGDLAQLGQRVRGCERGLEVLQRGAGGPADSHSDSDMTWLEGATSAIAAASRARAPSASLAAAPWSSQHRPQLFCMSPSGVPVDTPGRDQEADSGGSIGRRARAATEWEAEAGSGGSIARATRASTM